jgi:hypothetical protein
MAQVERFKAKYAFAGVGAELARSCPLAPDETVVHQGRVRVHRRWRRPLGFYRITPQRLSVVCHRAFGADEVIEVPRSCITMVHPPDERGTVRIDCADESSIELSPFSWAQVFAAGARSAQPRSDPTALQAVYERYGRNAARRIGSYPLSLEDGNAPSSWARNASSVCVICGRMSRCCGNINPYNHLNGPTGIFVIRYACVTRVPAPSGANP